MWVTDAISLLDDTNCKESCPGYANRFDPHLTYQKLDRDLLHEDVAQLKVQEYSYSVLQSSTDALVLAYIDMIAVQELNSVLHGNDW